MTNRDEAIENMLIAIGEEFDREIAHRETRGGQQVTHTGDFAAAGPSILSAMRRWSRDFRRVLALPRAEPSGTRGERERALVREGIRFGIRTFQAGLPAVWADERYEEADVDRIVTNLAAIVAATNEHIAKHCATVPSEAARHFARHPTPDVAALTHPAPPARASERAKGTPMDEQNRAEVLFAEVLAGLPPFMRAPTPREEDAAIEAIISALALPGGAR